MRNDADVVVLPICYWPWPSLESKQVQGIQDGGVRQILAQPFVDQTPAYRAKAGDVPPWIYRNCRDAGPRNHVGEGFQ